MKKIFAVLLLLAMTLCAAGAGAVRGDCGAQGSNVTWTLTENPDAYGTYTLTIIGRGAMKETFELNEAWQTSSYQIQNVVIEENVTSIGVRAFSGCYNLTSVTIPASVQTIGSNAFSNCTSLTSVSIPEGVTSIGDWAFASTGLTSVTIPENVTDLGYRAFHKCTGLENVTFLGTPDTIGRDNAFFECEKLTTISVPLNWTGPDSFYIGVNADGSEVWVPVTRLPAPAADLPTTGDSSSLALWLALLMLAALGAAAMRKRAA